MSRDVLCHQPQQLQCLHHGATFVCLCALILSSQPREVTIYGRHIMASVQDIIIDLRGTSHTIPCLLCCETSSTLLKWRHYPYNGFHVLRYGMHISRVTVHAFSIFFAMAGWIADMLSLLFLAYIAV